MSPAGPVHADPHYERVFLLDPQYQNPVVLRSKLPELSQSAEASGEGGGWGGGGGSWSPDVLVHHVDHRPHGEPDQLQTTPAVHNSTFHHFRRSSDTTSCFLPSLCRWLFWTVASYWSAFLDFAILLPTLDSQMLLSDDVMTHTAVTFRSLTTGKLRQLAAPPANNPLTIICASFIYCVVEREWGRGRSVPTLGDMVPKTSR